MFGFIIAGYFADPSPPAQSNPNRQFDLGSFQPRRRRTALYASRTRFAALRGRFPDASGGEG